MDCASLQCPHSEKHYAQCRSSCSILLIFTSREKEAEKNIQRCKEIDSQKQNLNECCKTKWVERQDASVRLTDLLRAVVDTVPVYSKLPSTTTREIADDSSLLHSICSFEFFMPDYSKRMSIINAKPKRGKWA